MTAAFSRTRAGAVLVAAALVLAACAEKEVILPGQREDIRPGVLAQGEHHDPSQNQSRAIRLPAQSANADWTQAAGTPAFRTANPALGPAPQLVWSAGIGQGDSRRQRITADPVVAGGRVFTLDANALVTATSTGGGTLWATDLTPPTKEAGDATGGGLAYADGTLYVSLGFGRLVALDAKTGARRWEQRLDATGSGSPAVSGGLIYLVAGDDTGWAVETGDGKVAWQFEATSSVAHVLGAPAPVLSGKYAIFAFGSGDVVAAFRKGGLRRWGATVAGQRKGRTSSRYGDVTGAPMLVGNTVYVGNHSGRIAAFDVESGERKWTARQAAFDPVWPAGDSIFAVTDDNQLVRMDAADGTTIWAADLPGFIKDRPKRRAAIYANHGPVLAGNRIWVASSDGYLRGFNPENGALVATIEVPGGASSSPVVAGRTLYVVTGKGQLLAFR